MDFGIDSQTQDMLDRARRFVDEELIPLEARFVNSSWADMEPTLREKRAKVKEMGLWAANLPQDIGGLGVDLVQLGLLSEVFGRTPTGHFCFGAQAPDAGNAELLHKYGTDEQKARWLQPLADGDMRSCFAMTEPATAGSNPTLLATTAHRDGENWVINGHKWFTSSCDGSDFAIAMVVTAPEGPPYMRASMIIVPTGTPGFTIKRNIPVMGHAGDGYASHAEVLFEDCRVPLSNILGPENAGFVMAQDRLGPGRIHHCMRWLGICQRSLDLMCQYTSQREIAPGRTLSSTQLIRASIADSAAEIAAARALVLQAAWTAEHQGFKEARDMISMIKYHVAGVMQRVVDRALQAHGALGMTDDTILAFFYRHERAARIYDGPDEVHKMSLAKRLLAARS